MMDQKALTYPAPQAVRSRLLACAVPIVLLVGLQLTYLLQPAFYLKYVLEEDRRENQAVELITFGSALIASLLILYAAWRLWRQGTPAPWSVGHVVRHRGGLLIVAATGLATFFFAGEEASWGQTYLKWETPTAYQPLSGETNLHNTGLNVKSLGDLFLVIIFFVLPALWVLRTKFDLPRSWAPGIAEGPVVFCMAAAFVWKLYKVLYRAFLLKDKHQDLFYLQFVEQINEHKEMLAAVSLLMYGMYRAGAVRRYVAKQ